MRNNHIGPTFRQVFKMDETLLKYFVVPLVRYFGE